MRADGMLFLLLTFASRALAQANGVQTSTWPVLGTPIAASDQYAPSVTPNIEWPDAPNAQNLCPGYQASNVQESASSLTADLTLAGPACNVYGTDIEQLVLMVEYQDTARLNVKIQPRYVAPEDRTQYLLDDYLVPSGKSSGSSTSNSSDLKFEWTNEPSFQFKVVRASSGKAIFDTFGSKIVFENQFLELVTSMVPDYNAYGLPESIRNFRIGNNYTQTFWNQYNVQNDQPMSANMHSVHPVYVETRYENSSSTSHAVFGRNMHGQEWLFRETSLTYRAIGGSFDLYFFGGPTVKEAIRQYQIGVVGTSMIPPYWALGNGQNRWGYANVSVLHGIVDGYADADIPLEIIWSDLDYMFQYRDFLNNPVGYPLDEFKDFLDRLHANGQYWMPILDPNIYAPNPNNESDANPPFDRLMQSGTYLREGQGKDGPYLGLQWPGYCAWPDFLVNSSQKYWTNELQLWQQQLPWDGFWLDINVLSSWCTGSCGTGNLDRQPVHVAYGLPGEPNIVSFGYPEGFELSNASEAAVASSAMSSLMLNHPTPTTTMGTQVTSYASPTIGARNIRYPPYALNNTLTGHTLEYWQIAPYATHNDEFNTTIYETHNLYGHLSGKASYNGLLEVFSGKRPFVLSRSTSPGDGNFTGHWSGDANSKWGNMYMTLSEALGFSIAGIPYFGVETCGFQFNSDYELCSRWMELSAFFPLYRNHNSRPGNTISQEPYVWASTAEATRRAIRVRFALLTYTYTLFWKANQVGDTVMRALAWEFPDDPSLAAVDNQFMVGPSILITPVLVPQATTVQGVFPGTEPWYDWYTLQRLDVQAGQNKTLDAPLEHINVHIRGGTVLATQVPGNTTRTTRASPWSLIIALDSKGEASGEIFLDDGLTFASATKNVEFMYSGGVLTVDVRGDFEDMNALANITIAGFNSRCSGIHGSHNDLSTAQLQQAGSTLHITELANAFPHAFVRSYNITIIS